MSMNSTDLKDEPKETIKKIQKGTLIQGLISANIRRALIRYNLLNKKNIPTVAEVIKFSKGK